MEQTKRSTFKLLFYLKKNEPKKNCKVISSDAPQAYKMREASFAVEPVLGTLTQFMGLRKVNALGIKQPIGTCSSLPLPTT